MGRRSSNPSERRSEEPVRWRYRRQQLRHQLRRWGFFAVRRARTRDRGHHHAHASVMDRSGDARYRNGLESRIDRPAGKAKRPWFIAGFAAAAALVTWVPVLKSAPHLGIPERRAGVGYHAFLIGSGLSRNALQMVGGRLLIQGFVLWILMGTGALAAILHGSIG
jgi:hypothetical protein